MTNDDDKDALEAAKKARWETGEWCGDSVEQFESGWYAHHDMTKGRTTCPTCLGEKPPHLSRREAMIQALRQRWNRLNIRIARRCIRALRLHTNDESKRSDVLEALFWLPQVSHGEKP